MVTKKIFVLDLFSQSSLVDLTGARGTHASPWGPNFFQFHAVFGNIWQNRMLVYSFPQGWRLYLGEIQDLPLVMTP